MSATNRTIKLSCLCWEVIRMLMMQPGWANTPRDIYQSGVLDEKLVLPKKPAADPKTGKIDPTKDAAWCDREVAFQLMGKEVDTIAKCLKANIEKANSGGGRIAKRLVETFLPDEC